MLIYRNTKDIFFPSFPNCIWERTFLNAVGQAHLGSVDKPSFTVVSGPDPP